MTAGAITAIMTAWLRGLHEALCALFGLDILGRALLQGAMSLARTRDGLRLAKSAAMRGFKKR
jgi:hypothetical protein